MNCNIENPKVKKRLTLQILNSDKSKLQWQLSECENNIELMYFHEDNTEISNTVIFANIKYFNKNIDFINSDNDYENNKINVFDDLELFEIEDIILCFSELVNKKNSEIKLEKIE